MSAREPTRTVRAGGLRLRVAATPGPGRPLLLVNGIGAALEMWRPLRRELPGLPLISFDAPGAGGSEAPPRPLRMRRLGGIAVEMLDALGVSEVDLLGYSFGGALAQQIAHDHPERVRSLILVATTAGLISVPGSPRALIEMLTPGRYWSAQQMARSVPRIAGGRIARDPALLRRHAADRLAVPPSLWGYATQLYAISGWTSLPWLTCLPQPTLVVAGDADPLVPTVNARLLAGAIPDARLHIVPAAGHLLLLDQPEDVAPVIREFLRSAAS